LTEQLVLDSWMLLAWLKDQAPGAAKMDELWHAAATRKVELSASMVNIGEVFYLTARNKGLDAAEELLEHLHTRPLQFVSASDRLVIEAARLKAAYPISYADAFAAATATRARCPLVTGDPEFRSLEKDGVIRLHWAG
jgi:predicted nucleic acid-binding protein